MVFRNVFPPILVIIFLSSILIGCNSTKEESIITQVEPTHTQVEPTLTPIESSPTPSEPTHTPKPKVVWSDDFEDGDTDGWEEGTPMKGDEYLVSEGVLSFGNGEGDTQYPSLVST